MRYGILNKRDISFLGRFIKSYFQKGRFTPCKIPRLSIETTNVCDAKCGFCANGLMRRSRECLAIPIFKKVVDEFVAMGGQEIDFNTTIGEPLLDPYLLERAGYVKQYPQFKSLGFVTNLQWLHKFNIDEFFAAGFTWLGISITLSGPKKYYEFFGVDRYEQTVKNLLRLIEGNSKRENKISLLLSIKPTDEPISMVINHQDFKMINSLIGYDLVGLAKDLSFFCDDWLGTIKLPPYLKRRPLYPRSFSPCKFLYKDLILFSNGNIGSCTCRDFEADSGLILGNAREITLKEAWEGEKIHSIRDGWRRKNKIPTICKPCSHYLY